MSTIEQAMAQTQNASGSHPSERSSIPTWAERALAAHPRSEQEYWPDALKVTYMEQEIAQLRAALGKAQS